MTTLTETRPTVGGASPNRVLAVVRLLFANPTNILVMPWLVLGSILLANIAVWAIVLGAASTPEAQAQVREGLGYSGATTFIFVYMAVVAIQSVNSYFPFALGFGVTRRNFAFGAGLSFLGLAAVFTVGLSILAAVEEATQGWGLGGRMFTVMYFGTGWVERGIAFFSLLMFGLFAGSAIAAIYVRYRGRGMVVFWVGTGFLLIAIAAIITWTKSWVAVIEWFAANGLIGNYLWSLVISAGGAIVGYLVLRGTTPRN
jgi:hypothetical protein